MVDAVREATTWCRPSSKAAPVENRGISPGMNVFSALSEKGHRGSLTFAANLGVDMVAFAGATARCRTGPRGDGYRARPVPVIASWRSQEAIEQSRSDRAGVRRRHGRSGRPRCWYRSRGLLVQKRVIPGREGTPSQRHCGDPDARLDDRELAADPSWASTSPTRCSMAPTR